MKMNEVYKDSCLASSLSAATDKIRCYRKKKICELFSLLTFLCLRACLHGGGGPHVGEVTRLGGVTRLSI